MLISGIKNKLLMVIAFISCISESVSQIKTSKFQEHVGILAADSLEGRGLGTDGSLKAIDYIEAQFREIGLKPFFEHGYRYNFTFGYGITRLNATNLVAVIEGSDSILKNEYIVLGAHHDHLGYKINNNKKIIWNGADDNASGVSTVIEVARILKNHQSSLKRSIIITTFDAEEIGLIGSRRLLYDSIFRVEKIKFMFSIDMVGRYMQNNGLRVKGTAIIEEGKYICMEIQKEMDIKLIKINKKRSKRSDCRSFLEYGIPASYFDTGLGKTYHKPNDTEEKIDYVGLLKITNFISQYCIKLSKAENITPAVKMKSENPNKTQFALKYEVGLGRSYFANKNEKYNSKNMLNVNLGVSKSINLTDFVILKPELLYSLNGGSDSLGIVVRHSIVAPINFHINTCSPVYVTLGCY